MKRCICVLLVSTVLFGGCMNRNRVANTFVQVEKALAVAPDSAMRLLKDIPAKSLGNQAMRARYALLYIDAAERAQLNENTDSLLRIAWRYYRKHPQEMQNRCRTLYYMAHSKLRQGDKPGALRLFLEAEENNDSLDNPRDRGMLYLSIGDVYRGELNFVRAYRYYREARELFLRSGDMRHRIEALLGMTACGLRMHDFEQTRRNCRLALELSDEAHYEQLAQKSLGYLAALYALSDRGSLPEEMLRRIEQSVHRDTTVTGFRTRSQIQLLRNRPDSARHYIERAERIANSEDLPMLLYTAYKADISAGRYQEATWNINKFIYYSDSLTRSSLQGSAGMIEKEYFRERSAFYDYRLQNRRTWEITIVAAALSLLGIAGYIIRAADTPASGEKRTLYAACSRDAIRISESFRPSGTESRTGCVVKERARLPVRHRGTDRPNLVSTRTLRFGASAAGPVGAKTHRRFFGKRRNAAHAGAGREYSP